MEVSHVQWSTNNIHTSYNNTEPSLEYDLSKRDLQVFWFFSSGYLVYGFSLVPAWEHSVLDQCYSNHYFHRQHLEDFDKKKNVLGKVSISDYNVSLVNFKLWSDKTT